MIALLFVVGCRESSVGMGDNKLIASVESRELRRSDLETLLPKGISGEDSIAFVVRYTKRWIQNSVKLLEAERQLASSAHDLDVMVEEYRNSLMVRRLEREYLAKNYTVPRLDTLVESYYRENGEAFKLNVILVKGRILTFSKDYKETRALRKEMATLASKRGGDFRSICEKRGLELMEATISWVEYSDFLSLLPIVRRGENLEYLAKKDAIQQLEDEDNIYYFQITEVMRAGEQEPLERVDGKIRYILNNKNQTEFLRRYEETLLHEAQKRGVIRNYTTDDNE